VLHRTVFTNERRKTKKNMKKKKRKRRRRSVKRNKINNRKNYQLHGTVLPEKLTGPELVK